MVSELEVLGRVANECFALLKRKRAAAARVVRFALHMLRAMTAALLLVDARKVAFGRGSFFAGNAPSSDRDSLFAEPFSANMHASMAKLIECYVPLKPYTQSIFQIQGVHRERHDQQDESAINMAIEAWF